MPTYEYACTSCGHHLEIFQSFSDEPLATCPNCAGSLRKVFGSIGIVLKGSGFYRTDNRPGSNGKVPTKGAETKGAEKKDAEKKDAAVSTSGGESAASGSTTSSSASSSPSSGSASSSTTAAAAS